MWIRLRGLNTISVKYMTIISLSVINPFTYATILMKVKKLNRISVILVTILHMSEPVQWRHSLKGWCGRAFQGLVLLNVILLADTVYYNPPYVPTGFVGFVSNHAPVQWSKLPSTHRGYSRVQINDESICWQKMGHLKFDPWPSGSMKVREEEAGKRKEFRG